MNFRNDNYKFRVGEGTHLGGAGAACGAPTDILLEIKNRLGIMNQLFGYVRPGQVNIIIVIGIGEDHHNGGSGCASVGQGKLYQHWEL